MSSLQESCLPKFSRISNPLAGVPRTDLLASAEAFARSSGLPEIVPMIKKGALVAADPNNFEDLDLAEDEKEALRMEVVKKWKHPFALYATIIICSLGAAVQGWDQTGSNGANLSFPVEFGIAAAAGEPNHDRDNWLVGLVNAAPYIASAFVGCWCSDPLNYLVGRRGAIFVSALILIVTPIGGALTQTWQQLFACRFLMSIGMGLKGSTTPVFAAENSPAAIRGALVMFWQSKPLFRLPSLLPCKPFAVGLFANLAS